MSLWLQKYDLKYTEVHVCEAKTYILAKDCKPIVTIVLMIPKELANLTIHNSHAHLQLYLFNLLAFS